MKLNKTKLCLIATLCIPVSVSASVSMELVQACFGSVELTDYVVNVAQGGSSSTDIMSDDEVTQIVTILGDEENADLDLSAKLEVVMTACTEGRILQVRNQRILNQQ